MEIDNGYYKRIVYKKNAFEDLKTYLKLNYNNKGICLISTKSIPSEEVTKLLNAVLCGSEKVSHFVARSGFDLRELERLNAKLSGGEFDLIISFGGGRCCDVVKYFAHKYKLPYIVCPTTASSVAYFDAYCINPYNADESFVACAPNKVFIQESIIKSANCILNINGLAFLHSLRAVFVEGVVADNENERYIFVGLEKLFNKLESEQTNILLCNEDSNLVLMDLIKSFKIYESIKNMKTYSYTGKEMLLNAKAILSIIKNYLEINTVKVLEMPRFEEISEIVKNCNIGYEDIKNFEYFSTFMKKAYIKRNFLSAKESIYKLVCMQIYKINEFCKKVKSVYKHGIEIEEEYECLTKAIKITPYLYGENDLINLIAGSGILNSL